MLITRLMKNGPGHRAGLQIGDVITHVNNQSVNNPIYTMNLIVRNKPGEKVSIQVNRNGKPVNLVAIIGTRPDVRS